MSNLLDYLLAVLFGIVEGVTEWLPVSSTGHMIILERFLHFQNVSESFFEMFLVVIQLGAILAVVVLFWHKIFPVTKNHRGRLTVSKDILVLWIKIIAACVPAAVVGLLFDKFFEKHFYNYVSVAIALIVFGIAFILVEILNKNKRFVKNSLSKLTFLDVTIIGVFQLIAAIFPGTSRSGATILGAILIGVSRPVAAEFTFFLAIPVMAGASLLKIVKYDAAMPFSETICLLIGMVTAFAVSMAVIKFLMGYVKKHDFKPFGWYRIILGVVLLLIWKIY